MSRLIDADALIEEVKSLQVFVTGLRAGKGILNEYTKQYRESLLRIVDEQPTAYKVDAVVSEIQKEYCKKCRNILGVPNAEKYCEGVKCDIGKICDIVRRGGVE